MSVKELKELVLKMSSIRSRECNEVKRTLFVKLCIEGEYPWLREVVDHSQVLANKDTLRRVETELDISPILEMYKPEKTGE